MSREGGGARATGNRHRHRAVLADPEAVRARVVMGLVAKREGKRRRWQGRVCLPKPAVNGAG
eukprot:2859416-Lingulodinium_polyedra.AAC.1